MRVHVNKPLASLPEWSCAQGNLNFWKKDLGELGGGTTETALQASGAVPCSFPKTSGMSDASLWMALQTYCRVYCKAVWFWSQTRCWRP